MKSIFKVIRCMEPFEVSSAKSEGGTLRKRVVVLQELGNQYENSYVATMLGAMADCQLYADDLLAASLRFRANDYNNNVYQDVTLEDFRKISK